MGRKQREVKRKGKEENSKWSFGDIKGEKVLSGEKKAIFANTIKSLNEKP